MACLRHAKTRSFHIQRNVDHAIAPLAGAGAQVYNEGATPTYTRSIVQGAGCDIGAFELEQYQISGSTGMGEVTLEIGGSAPHQVTSDSSGDYAFFVFPGWSGAVTPVKEGYFFTPGSRGYSSVQGHRAAQDFSARPPLLFFLPVVQR